MGIIKRLYKKFFVELNRRGVSATVITIILLVVGLAILVIFLIGIGQTGSENVSGISETLENIRQGV